MTLSHGGVLQFHSSTQKIYVPLYSQKTLVRHCILELTQKGYFQWVRKTLQLKLNGGNAIITINLDCGHYNIWSGNHKLDDYRDIKPVNIEPLLTLLFWDLLYLDEFNQFKTNPT